MSFPDQFGFGLDGHMPTFMFQGNATIQIVVVVGRLKAKGSVNYLYSLSSIELSVGLWEPNLLR